MELILTEKGIEQKSKPKLTELGREEILEKSAKRLNRPLALVENGKVTARQCKKCFNAVDANSNSPYCLICIEVIANEERAKLYSKDLRIFIWAILIAGFFVALIASLSSLQISP